MEEHLKSLLDVLKSMDDSCNDSTIYQFTLLKANTFKFESIILIKFIDPITQNTEYTIKHTSNPI